MDNRTEKRKIGDLGEELACRYLLQKGFKIVERNYWKPYGEIDIVGQIGERLVFFEVKTVTRGTFSNISHETGSTEGESGTRVTPRDVPRERVYSSEQYKAEDNIHPWKIKRLQKAIESYLSRFRNEPEWQIDALIVSLDKVSRTAKIKRIEGIVL
jgi:putative endonuclease